MQRGQLLRQAWAKAEAVKLDVENVGARTVVMRDRAAVANGSGPADQLAKLANLKDRGVLTDAEFEAEKAKILS
jgi:hypothetical protein